MTTIPLENPVDQSLPTHFDSSARLVTYSDDDEIVHPLAVAVDKLQREFEAVVSQADPPLHATIDLCVAYTNLALAMNPANPNPSPWFFSITICTPDGRTSPSQAEIQAILRMHDTFVGMIQAEFEISENFRGLIRYRMSDDVDF